MASTAEGSMGMHRINLNDEAYDSPEKAGPSRTFLPPGAASPISVSPPNPNREFAPPPLPPRRPADVGSMHTRRPSYNATSPQSHADEMGGRAYEPLSPGTTSTATTSPATALGHSLVQEADEPVGPVTEGMQPERLEEEDDDVGDKTVTQPVEGMQIAPSAEAVDAHHALAEKEVDPKRG